jgi:hypothetical protein
MRIGRSMTVKFADICIASMMAIESAPGRARISTGKSDHGGCRCRIAATWRNE